MSLQLIMEKHQSKVFKKYFAFFAYSNKQFEEGKNINFKYVSLGSGLYAPKEFAIKIIEKLDSIYKNAIEKRKATTSKKDIIWYELANYETQLTGDLTDAMEALEGYGYSEEEIKEEYKKYYDNCVKNNYF